MLRRLAIISSVLLVAVAILAISVFRTASIKYEFSQEPSAIGAAVLGEATVEIDYYLAYPGRVLPDHPLWPLKALRDRLWFLVTTNPSRKAELNLLFADKRLGSSKLLFEKGKAGIAYSTLTKAEKYLEETSNLEKENRREGIDTSAFLERLAKASLKHFQVMQEILAIAPEDAKPGIIQTEDYAKRAYEDARNALLEKGLSAPENPFDWN
jgi:hypothetical protein